MGSVANPLNCLPLTARFNGTEAGLPVTENEARGLLVVRKQAYLRHTVLGPTVRSIRRQPLRQSR